MTVPADISLTGAERRALKFLTRGDIVRRNGGWRFVATAIGDVVVERLIANGLVRICGASTQLATSHQTQYLRAAE